MTGLRILIGALIAGAIAVALVPLAVLVDLKDGGTGWGLCPQGLGGCRTSYFAGFELLGGVVVVLFAILALIHLCVRLLRRLERRQAPVAAPQRPVIERRSAAGQHSRPQQRAQGPQRPEAEARR